MKLRKKKIYFLANGRLAALGGFIVTLEVHKRESI